MNDKMERIKWLPEEEILLKENYPKFPLFITESKLPRHTKGSIIQKAKKFKLKRLQYVNERILTEKFFRPIRFEDFSSFEKGYLAGIIDGEGTISISLDKRKNQLVPYIIIVNTNYNLIMWLKRKLQCPLIIKRRRDIHSDVFVARISRVLEVEKILNWSKDDLIVKKAQANLLLNFCEIKKSKIRRFIRDKKTGRFIKPLCSKISKREWSIYKRIKKLNKRGVNNRG